MNITEYIHKKITGLAALFLLSVCGYAQDIQYGLNFKSYEVEKERRTSLNLSPEKPLSLPSDYTLSFDLKLNSYSDDLFGYVFRIFDENGKNISFLLNFGRNGYNNMLFTYSAEELFSAAIDEIGMKLDEWYTVKVNVNTHQRIFKVILGEKELFRTIPELESFDKINVIFGRNNQIGLEITDIPSIAVKDIRIYNEQKQKLLYEWPLKRYMDKGTYDEVRNQLAIVENPDWLIDQHAFWEKKVSITTDLHSQIVYNAENNEVNVYCHPLFYTYNLTAGDLSVDTLGGSVPWGTQTNSLLYNHRLKRYIYYTFDVGNAADVLVLDPDAMVWDRPSNNQFPPDYWHHNRLVADYDGKLYLFGGYGFHRYKNDVQIYDFLNETWEKTQLRGNFPHPHYLSGLGVLDDQHILIFGGYGSETGNQSLEPRFIYDLYKVNLQTLVSEKLWSLDALDNNFVISNSLVVDTTTRTFYALTYSLRQFNTTATLMRFSIDQPIYEILGDSIPIHFEDTKSYVDLFHDKKTNRLIAAVSSPATLHGHENTVSLYTLAYPPLSEVSLYQLFTIQKQKNLRFMIVGIVLLVLTGLGIYTYRKNRKKRSEVDYIGNDVSAMEEAEELWTQDPVSGSEDLRTNRSNEIKEVFAGRSIGDRQTAGSVFLFGGFCVIDKDCEDVTKNFAPILKQLFLLILLYTYKDRKGISFTRMKETLWYDKSDESAKNNRGVSIRKLRQIFETVGDISIINNNSYWAVEFGKGVYCDYPEALFLMDKLAQEEYFCVEDLKKLLSILSRGELLPNLQVEWLDSFKADFSNNLMDILSELSQKQQVLEDLQLCVDIADAIFIQDSLNEDALRLKCAVLVKMGRNKLSKKIYESFVKEYRLLFDSDFEYSFEQIISSD